MFRFLQGHDASWTFHDTDATAFTVVHIDPPGILDGNSCLGTKQTAVITIVANTTVKAPAGFIRC